MDQRCLFQIVCMLKCASHVIVQHSHFACISSNSLQGVLHDNPGPKSTALAAHFH